MTSRRRVVVEPEGDSVIVRQTLLHDDRDARLFFRSILGAERIEDGWRCPRRRQSLNAIALQVNAFLEQHGWEVERRGVVDDAVERELQRRRSFQRTRDAASELRDGVSYIDPEAITAALTSMRWNFEQRTLRPHQLEAVVHGLTAVNVGNFSVPGSGKTAATLALAACHLANDTIDVIVVIGPLSCFGPWETEAERALPGRLDVRRVRGAAAGRRTTYQAARRESVLIVSYASAAADKSWLIELCRNNRVMLIVDESHRVKRFRGGLWAPALNDIARHARVRLVLSGTPMPQNGRDLYSQLNIMWPAAELTGPRDTFAARVDRDFDGVLADVQPFVSRTPKSALGLEPYRIIRHDVSITGVQKEIYELIEGNFRRRIDDAANWQDKLAALRRGRPIRLLQALANPHLLNRSDPHFGLRQVEQANPTLMQRLAAYDPDADVPAKTRAALGLVREIVERGEKVVCWSSFVPNLDHFAARVRQEIGVATYQIDGRVPAGDETADEMTPRAPHAEAETREQVIADFLTPGTPAVLITNPPSCSESISLHQTCHNAIYLDRTYDCALFLQSIDRIHRLGLPDGVTVEVHILLATSGGRRTADHVVDASLQQKDAAMQVLLQGARLQSFQVSDDPLTEAEGSDDDLGMLLRYLLGERAQHG